MGIVRFSPGFSVKLDGDGAVDLLTAADPGFVAVGEITVFSERLARVNLRCQSPLLPSSNVV